MSRTTDCEAAGFSSRARTRALVLVAGAALSTAAFVPSAAAQLVVSASSNNVNGGASIPWMTGTNWVGGTAPVSNIDNSLVFNYDFGSAALTANNNNPAGFNLNSITVNSDSPGGFTVNGNSVNFNTSSVAAGSAGPHITNAGNQFSTFSITNPVLNAPLTIDGAGFGNMTLTYSSGGGISSVSGAGGINFNMTGPGAVIFSGSGTHTYTGPVVLNSGDVVIAGNNQPFGAAANPVTVNGGTIRLSTGATIVQNITLNSTLNLTGNSGSIPVFTGAISGTGYGVSWRSLANSESLTLQGNNTFSGAFVAQPQGSITTTNGFTTLSGANGAMSNVSSVTLTDGQGLRLDSGTAANNNRLNDSAPITLNTGTLEIRSNLSSAAVENVGAITITGGSTLMANSWGVNSTANATLNASSLTRSSRGTLTVLGANLGSANAIGHTSSTTGNIVVGAGPALVGGGGASGSTNVSIVPFAFAYNGAIPNGGTTGPIGGQLVTYDATNGFRPLAASEYASTYQNEGSTSSNNLRSSNVVIGGSTQANAVVINTSPASASTGSGLYMKPGSVLTITSGELLSSLDGVNSSAPSPTALPSIVAGGTLDFGASEGIVHTQNSTAILSTITGSQGLTKGGGGNLILASGNTFSGPVTVNSGTVAIDSDSALGNASNSVTLASGGFSGLTFAPSVLLGDSVPQGNPFQNVTISRNINLVGAGGGLGSALLNGSLTASGVISGSGSLYAGTTLTAGVLKLTGANTYTGQTVLLSNLAVNSDQNLGAGSDIILDGGYLRNDGVLATSKDITVNNNASMFLTNADATLSGIIKNQGNSSGFTLTKSGTSNLTLTAASPFNGILQIGQALGSGTPLTSGQDRYVTGGTVTLSGAGALPAAASIQINGGSTLVLNNSGTNTLNRITGNVGIGGGTLEFVGNDNAPSTETIGTLTFTSGNSPATANGTAVVTIIPGTGQSAVLTASDLVKGGVNNTLLVRGLNLGGTPGPNTANLKFNTSTTGALASGNYNGVCIGGVVVDTSPTGNGTDLATYGANGIVAASYLAGDGFDIAKNSDLITGHTLAADTPASAIRISDGGGIDVGGFALNMQAPATILAVGSQAKTISNSGGSNGKVSFPAAPATIWNNCDLTVSVPLTGLTGLNKSGTGNLTLNMSSPLPNPTVVVASNGTLTLGNAGVLPTTVASGVTTGNAALVAGSQEGSLGTIDLGGFPVVAASLSGIGNVINSGSLTVTSNNSADFAGTMTGTGSLTISGSMRISGGNSTYTGSTTVRNGATLTISADQRDDSGPLGKGNGGGGGSVIVGDATTSGLVQVNSNVSVFNKNIYYPASTATTAPIFSSTGGSTGANSLVVNGTVTMGRNVQLAGFGSQQNSLTFPFAGRVVTYTGTVQDDTANSKAGTFEWGGGCINLMAANAFSGGVNAHPGSADPETCFLGIGNNNALGTGTIRATGAASGNLLALSGAKTINNGLYWTTSSASRLGFAGMNDLTIGDLSQASVAQVDLGGGYYASQANAGTTNGVNNPLSVAGARTWNVINTGTTTIAGAISGTSAATLTKNGDGRLVMSGANTFAGSVTLNAGTLLVNGSNGGAGSYTVNSGAILGGAGSITGPVSVAAGGIIEPGDSPGTLSTGALSLVAGSTMTYELAAANTVGGGVNDLVAITGNLSAPASGVVVNIQGLPGFGLPVGGSTYTLMTYTGSLTGSAASFQLGFAPSFVTGATFDTTSSPGAVLITVVPTPGSFGILGIAGVLAARRRRR
jgi:autotransporter-associated beta strand protein